MGRVYKIPVFFFFVILSTVTSGQSTKINGEVHDSLTGEPIPFANVFFKGTTIGVTSDFKGRFHLEASNPSDTLTVSCMGYKPQHIKIVKNRFQEINVILSPSNINLSEVVFVAGENPANIIMRKVIANKDKNDIKNLDYYQYQVYNKVEVDVNNITEKFREKRFPKPFRFIFDYMDTSSVSGKPFLPVFLSETFSDFYYRAKPKAEREIIKAVKTSGVKNESLMKYMGEMFQNDNIYNNFILIVGKNFVSPVSDNGFAYYKYYLTDSTFIDGKWCYKIMFKPKRKQELTFTGDLWINDTTWAIKSYEMSIADDANLNYLNSAILKKDFELVDGTHWMTKRNEIFADINLFENTDKVLGFFVRKTTRYDNFVLNSPLDDKFYTQPVKVFIADDAVDKPDEFWEQKRPEELSKNERTIYFMIDTLTNLPVFRTWENIIKTVFTGYLNLDKFELGPYMGMFSYNAIEGARFRMGGRTTKELNEHFRLDGYVAYGTKDQKVKYGAGMLFVANKNPRRTISANYKYDIEQLGASPTALRNDLLITSVFRRNPADKMSMTRELTLCYEHEWYNGLMNRFNFIYKEILPVGEEQVKIIGDNGDIVNLSKITTSEFRIDTRISFHEKFIIGNYNRSIISSRYPVIGVKYSFGVPGMFNGNYRYHKLRIGMKHWFNVFNIGWTKYIVEAGKIWGKLPWPLLRLHPGNETFIYNDYAYNLMNYFEFVSDMYASLSYTHHFDGFFLNRIPLIRKLKWREVVHFRGVIGSLGKENKQYNILPVNTHTLNKPYMEAGVGLENVFKFVRVDCVWRLTHLDSYNASNFGVFMTLNFSF